MNISFPPPGSDDQAPPSYPEAAEIACDGWWPSVNLLAVRDAVRVPSGETERLRDAVRQAMLDIAHELAAWRAGQEAAGYTKLADVPGRMRVDGKSDYELRWFRAVYSVVAADVGERALGPQLSGAGAERAEALRADVNGHLRNVSFAVRDFLGRPRIVAEAI